MVADPRHFYCDVAGGDNFWWWCDALFMHPPVHLRLSRITGDPSYTNLMHMMWAETQSCLYDTNDHLFYRDITYFGQIIGGQKVFWSRGDGWVVGGIVRVLQYLPQDDPNRPVYITLLQEMAAKLAQIQMPDGYWYSNLLYPQQFNVPETSGTGFFCYGIAWGINNGYLDEATYEPVMQKAWAALKAAVHEDGKLGWVQPVGAGPAASTYDSTAVYGVGAYLLAGSEVQKYYLSKDPSFIDYFETYNNTNELKAAWKDGTTNGTDAEIALGNYGDRFMELEYDNNSAPYDSRVDRVFAVAQDWEVNDFAYLSILIQGKVGNAADDIYVELEDQSTNSSRVYVNDVNVVDTYIWNEVAFPFTAFEGVNLNAIKRLSIGVGSKTPAASGTGTIRIDTIRLYPAQCFSTIAADFDDDCKVGFSDLAVLASQWMDEYVEVIVPVKPNSEDVTAYWDFNEPSGATAYDSSGNNRNATLVYCTWEPNSGKEFGAVRIYKSVPGPNNNGRVEFPASAITLPAGTFSAWLYLDSSQSSPATRYILGHTSLPVYGDRIQLYMDNGDTQLDCGMGDVHALITNIATLPTVEWVHIAMTWNGTTVKVYVSGIEKASSGYSDVNTLQIMAQLGNTGISSPAERFRGMFDEVSFYDKELTPGEILYLAEAEPSPPEIPNPRKTDLYLDGVINLKDLKVFVLSWLENNSWP
jgi:hypothetical protein